MALLVRGRRGYTCVSRPASEHVRFSPGRRSGTIEYELEGRTVRLQAGESLYIPAGAVHSAKNVSTGITGELATYVVEKDQPIVILAK
jgi:mannose-6-phosphate isomerase-like protein (cupin superfamily)